MRRSARVPWWLLLGVIAVVTLAMAGLAACGSGPVEDPASAAPHILTVAAGIEPTTWDPAVSYSTEIAWMPNMYEGLIRANPPGSAEPYSPLLATKWSTSDDGLEWTFNLREGVTFHDGTPFNAEAVKWSLERTIDMGEGASWIWGAVKEIQVVDEYTVKIILKSPQPLEAIAASGYGAWIVSPGIKDKGKDFFAQAGGAEAGTGPYLLESYTPKEEAVFAKYGDYWGGWDAAKYSKIVYKYVADQTQQRQLLETGEVGVAQDLTMKDAMPMKSNADLQVGIFPSFVTDFIYVNTQRAPLDDVKVRQALSYATPYKDIIELCQQGQADQSRGPCPQTLWPNIDQNLPQYAYDIDKAKQLLSEAGHGDGFKVNLVTNANRPYQADGATLIKESFGKIGVDVTIKNVPWPQAWDVAKGPADKRQDMLWIMWWPAYSDGYDCIGTVFKTEKVPLWNLSYWYNDAFDKTVDEAFNLTVTDPTKSQELYNEAQTTIIDEAAAVYLYDSKVVVAADVGIDGVAMNPNYQRVLFWYDLAVK